MTFATGLCSFIQVLIVMTGGHRAKPLDSTSTLKHEFFSVSWLIFFFLLC